MPNGRSLAPGRILTVAAAVTASFVLAVPGSHGRGVGGEGERRVEAESRFSVIDASLQAKLVMLVVDFPPGA
jgi:hypothetical protein